VKLTIQKCNRYQLYTVSQQVHQARFITLSILDGFLKFIYWHTLWKFATKLSFKIPPHLKRVATILHEI